MELRVINTVLRREYLPKISAAIYVDFALSIDSKTHEFNSTRLSFMWSFLQSTFLTLAIGGSGRAVIPFDGYDAALEFTSSEREIEVHLALSNTATGHEKIPNLDVFCSLFSGVFGDIKLGVQALELSKDQFRGLRQEVGCEWLI